VCHAVCLLTVDVVFSLKAKTIDDKRFLLLYVIFINKTNKNKENNNYLQQHYN